MEALLKHYQERFGDFAVRGGTSEGRSPNQFPRSSFEISDDYHHWANVTPPECDRLKELELKRDILNTTKAIMDAVVIDNS